MAASRVAGEIDAIWVPVVFFGMTEKPSYGVPAGFYDLIHGSQEGKGVVDQGKGDVVFCETFGDEVEQVLVQGVPIPSVEKSEEGSTGGRRRENIHGLTFPGAIADIFQNSEPLQVVRLLCFSQDSRTAPKSCTRARLLYCLSSSSWS